MTKYLDDHPGGSAVLIEVAGSDATEAFEEIGHSDEAREQLEPYYVGDLPEEVIPAKLPPFLLRLIGLTTGPLRIRGDIPAYL